MAHTSLQAPVLIILASSEHYKFRTVRKALYNQSSHCKEYGNMESSRIGMFAPNYQ